MSQVKEKHHEKPHPKPHGKKHRPKGAGADLSVSAKTLLQNTFPGPAGQTRVLEQLQTEGPDHKQIHAALLLQSMSQLITEVEKQTKSSFSLQPAENLASIKHEDEAVIKVPVPLASLPAASKDEVLETLSHAPEHELILFSTLLQSIEWMKSAISRDTEMKKN